MDPNEADGESESGGLLSTSNEKWSGLSGQRWGIINDKLERWKTWIIAFICLSSGFIVGWFFRGASYNLATPQAQTSSGGVGSGMSHVHHFLNLRHFSLVN
jgi:hypothetical protein